MTVLELKQASKPKGSERREWKDLLRAPGASKDRASGVLISSNQPTRLLRISLKEVGLTRSLFLHSPKQLQIHL